MGPFQMKTDFHFVIRFVYKSDTYSYPKSLHQAFTIIIAFRQIIWLEMTIIYTVHKSPKRLFYSFPHLKKKGKKKNLIIIDN